MSEERGATALVEFGRELAIARLAAERAGLLIAKHWDGAFEVQFKGDVDLVSEVDLASERLLVAALQDAFPDDALLGEEGGIVGPESARTWHIDPLDGTTNFSHGFPQFCVSIALTVASVPVVGVVHEPIRGWTFSAVRGGGAWLGGRSLSVSETPSLDGALLATGFPYDRRTNPDNNIDRVEAMLTRVQGIRRAGSAALDLCFVAAGWLDGFWEDRLNSWDLAAGALIIEEAGGRVSGPDGSVLDIARGAVVGSNGQWHDTLLRALRDASRHRPIGS